MAVNEHENYQRFYTIRIEVETPDGKILGGRRLVSELYTDACKEPVSVLVELGINELARSVAAGVS